MLRDAAEGAIDLAFESVHHRRASALACLLAAVSRGGKPATEVGRRLTNRSDGEQVVEELLGCACRKARKLLVMTLTEILARVGSPHAMAEPIDAAFDRESSRAA